MINVFLIKPFKPRGLLHAPYLSLQYHPESNIREPELEKLLIVKQILLVSMFRNL